MRWTILMALFAFPPILVKAQTPPADAKSEKSFEGDASILTNYVWHGITQTKRQPAIQTELLYNMGSALQLGLWGSNVSFYNTNKANALLKLLANLDLRISPNFEMLIHFADDHYFEPADRDGNNLGIEFKVFTYSILYEQNSNWQGERSSARYFAVDKTWDVFGGRWKWANHIGYTQFSKSIANNYFDIKTGLGIATGNIFWQGYLTTTSDNSQFGTLADYFIVLAGTAKF